MIKSVHQSTFLADFTGGGWAKKQFMGKYHRFGLDCVSYSCERWEKKQKKARDIENQQKTKERDMGQKQIIK